MLIRTASAACILAACGSMTGTSFIQRVMPNGGVAPAAVCAAGNVGAGSWRSTKLITSSTGRSKVRPKKVIL